ncbi:MAG TPA: glycosyltransferase family 1 protein [Patescibacteria group bacterium]
MRIAIDARFYGPQTKGLGRYIERLTENLEKIDHQNHYLIFLGRDNWDQYQPQNGNFSKVLADFKWYGLAEQLKMPYLLWKHRVDLVHFPHFNVPLLNLKKFVVTIHDLILIQYPTPRATTLSPFLYKIKNFFYKLVIAAAVQRSEKVITVSEYSKSQILKQFKINSEKVVVTYLACDSVESGQLKMPESNLQKYGIDKPYLLYVGNAYPHKNLERLLTAFKKFTEIFGAGYQLVLVGKKDYFYQRLEESCNDDNVIFCGYVSQPVLADLYRNARLYVFPSLLEGFGLPALEAMRYDLPVVASAAASLPEILGQAALYFNPNSIDDMITKMRHCLTDHQTRQNLINLGRIQITKYKWLDCAQKTLLIYQNYA